MFLRSIATVSVPRQFSICLLHIRNESSNEGKDNTIENITVDTSIRYLKSKAYKQTYGENLVWELYRRPQTSHFLGPTRKTCIRSNKISTGSPCPICRDKFLVLHHENTKLLKQFISEVTGELLPSKKTGLCQRQQTNLEVAVMKAKDYGIISFYVPFRYYDYNYYKKLAKQPEKE